MYVCVFVCVCVCVHVYVFSSIIYEEREIYVLEVRKGIEFAIVHIGEGGQGESLERDLQYVVYLYIIFVL